MLGWYPRSSSLGPYHNCRSHHQDPSFLNRSIPWPPTDIFAAANIVVEMSDHMEYENHHVVVDNVVVDHHDGGLCWWGMEEGRNAVLWRMGHAAAAVVVLSSSTAVAMRTLLLLSPSSSSSSSASYSGTAACSYGYV